MKAKSIIVLSAVTSGLALGGEPVAAKAPVAAKEPVQDDWSWCSIYDTLGKPVYDSPDNPLFQSLKFGGRFQWQTAYIDGDDVNGDGFSESFDEIRRFRLGGELKFLKYFKLKGEGNFVADGTPSGGSRDWGYQNLDALRLSVDLGKAFDIESFDKVVLNYGRHKVLVGHEVHQSSKKIKTVERSAVANKLYPTRATGVTLDLEKGNWSGGVGVFSTSESDEIAGWSEGTAFWASSGWELASGDELLIDFLYNDGNSNPGENELGDNQGFALYEWAASVAYKVNRDRWEVLFNASYGDNGTQSSSTREGAFWGFVVIPTYWIVEDKWEAVARYSYQGAEEDNGIRTNSRYFRRDNGGSVNSGRGDEHHSIYGGINYYICGDKAKVMTGVEWETLDTNSGDADATTLWLAYRTYF